MVRVIDALPLDLFAANVRAVVARPWHDGTYSAVGADHIDLLGARPLGNENFAADPGPGAVGGDGVARVAAGILHDLLNTDRFAVRNQGGGSAVLKGQRRHKIVHFEQHVLVQPDDGRHALAQTDAAPALIVQRQKAPVAKQAPFVPVDLREIKFRRLKRKLPESAAGTVCRARSHSLFPAAFCADEFHSASSLFTQFRNCFEPNHDHLHPRFPLASSR